MNKLTSIATSLVAFTILSPAFAQPIPTRPDITVRLVATAVAIPDPMYEDMENPVRLVKDPRDNTLYFMNQLGEIYRIDLLAGTTALAYSVADHTLRDTQGLAIGPDGTMYVVGNDAVAPNFTTRARIIKGIPDMAGVRIWSLLAQTEVYPVSSTFYSHRFNGALVSLDGNFLYVNSGARTDHGEEDNLMGMFPGARDVGLTTCIFKLPTSGSGIMMPNDRAALRSAGYVFVEGIRNTFDMAFAPNGDLFGTENAGDRDDPEELNWLREGRHYGFPWRMGGNDNPQQFPGYNPMQDRLLDPRYGAVQFALFHDDPSFPPSPGNFTEPLINRGPDADSFRDPNTGALLRASELGQTIGTFSAHRSPLGIVFDDARAMSAEFNGHGFMLSWTEGDPNGEMVVGPFRDASQDLVDLRLIQVAGDYELETRRLVGGFQNPIDSEIIGNRIYVVEYGPRHGIWEVQMP